MRNESAYLKRSVTSQETISFPPHTHTHNMHHKQVGSEIARMRRGIYAEMYVKGAACTCAIDEYEFYFSVSMAKVRGIMNRGIWGRREGWQARRRRAPT